MSKKGFKRQLASTLEMFGFAFMCIAMSRILAPCNGVIDTDDYYLLAGSIVIMGAGIVMKTFQEK